MTDSPLDVPFDGDIGTQQLLVDPKQGPIRLDRYLGDRLGSISRNRLQQAIVHHLVLVNEQACKPSYKVRPQDSITVHLPQCLPPSPVLPEPMDLSIVYEDEHLLLVDKPPNLVVHPAHGNWHGTLLQGLLYHLRDSQAHPYLVHRIDKDTSGLLVVAKSEACQAALASQFFYHSLHRQYLALVWGVPRAAQGVIDASLARHPKDRRMVAVSSTGKAARTHYQVLTHWQEISLVRCVLETGRTHQVRAHLKHLGHPVLADERYGGKQILRGPATASYKRFIYNVFEQLPRQALHATALGFSHTLLGKEMCFYSPLPADMLAVIAKWKRKV